MSRKQEAKILQQLDTLAPAEAHLLLAAVEKNAQTIYWQSDAGEISSLVAKGLLQRSPDDSTLLHKPFSIPRFVWDHIKQPEISRELKTKTSQAKEG